MSIIVPASNSVEPVVDADPISWRRLSWRLWVGRSDGMPAGVIERGNHYTFTTPSGVAHRGFRSLMEAQDAATGPIDIIDPPAQHPRLPAPVPVLLIAATTVAGAAALALSAVGLALVP